MYGVLPHTTHRRSFTADIRLSRATVQFGPSNVTTVGKGKSGLALAERRSQQATGALALAADQGLRLALAWLVKWTTSNSY